LVEALAPRHRHVAVATDRLAARGELFGGDDVIQIEATDDYDATPAGQ